MERKILVLVAALFAAVSLLACMVTILALVMLSTRQAVCHSPSEDSTPVDCDYQGDTDSWVPREVTR